VAPLASHEKLFVSFDFIDEDENHGGIECQECHGGDPADPDWTTAHDGVIRDPSYEVPEKTCGKCHGEEVEHYKTSLHYSLSTFYDTVGQRAGKGTAAYETVHAATGNYCGKCHSSCGQCHISRPDSVDGGLLEGHVFQKSPPNELTCTACHGSRIGKEYYGENEGLKPDIHHEKYMKCEKCHTGSEMHGDGKEYASRYEVENGPECIDCHSDIYGETAETRETHAQHQGRVSCRVCHSQSYKNCYSCHLTVGKDGAQSYTTEPSSIGFKIGLNPSPSGKNPEKFVVVRHVPVDKDLFSVHVENGLPAFDTLPTWKFATPHNIRRKTQQNETCNSCHGNASLYLLDKDVVKTEKAANKNVIVPGSMVPDPVDLP
jgi:thiosulfate/3-mercaptopyruvate sulfurtransferase